MTPFWTQANNALSTCYGAISAAIIVIGQFMAPVYYPFAVVFICIGMDLFWGIAVARKQKKFFLSGCLRDTCTKVAIYMSSLLCVFLIEQMFNAGGIFFTCIIAAIAGSCEIFSFSASILIIRPNFPFISIFKNQLKGEMEKKLGTSIPELQ